MTTTDAPTRPSAVPEPEKRRQILAGARAVFLAKGFDGASMDAIAKTAGVSKGTLYVYFQDKEALFEALILDSLWSLPEHLTAFEEDGKDLGSRLTAIGRSYASKLVNPKHVSLVRMVIGAVEKFPAFGRLLFRAGPAAGLARMTDVMRREMDVGRLRPADPEVAAMHFMDLCGSGLLRRMMFAVETDTSPARLEQIIADAVDVFLRAYGPERR